MKRTHWLIPAGIAALIAAAIYVTISVTPRPDSSTGTAGPAPASTPASARRKSEPPRVSQTPIEPVRTNIPGARSTAERPPSEPQPITAPVRSTTPSATANLPPTGAMPASPGGRGVGSAGPPEIPTPDTSAPPAPGAPSPDLDAVRFLIRDFRAIEGENPVGTNADITKALMGGNKKGARLLPPEAPLNGAGEIVDRWGTPYFFHQLSKLEMEIRSAGPDRVLWTNDDVVTR